jgi:hypothetical protein
VIRDYLTVSPVEFPVLTPREYIWLATGKGNLSHQAAYILSGYNRGSWYNWYNKGSLPKDRGVMERLYNIADSMGWIDEAIAS